MTRRGYRKRLFRGTIHVRRTFVLFPDDSNRGGYYDPEGTVIERIF